MLPSSAPAAANAEVATLRIVESSTSGNVSAVIALAAACTRSRSESLNGSKRASASRLNRGLISRGFVIVPFLLLFSPAGNFRYVFDILEGKPNRCVVPCSCPPSRTSLLLQIGRRFGRARANCQSANGFVNDLQATRTRGQHPAA